MDNVDKFNEAITTMINYFDDFCVDVGVEEGVSNSAAKRMIVDALEALLDEAIDETGVSPKKLALLFDSLEVALESIDSEAMEIDADEDVYEDEAFLDELVDDED